LRIANWKSEILSSAPKKSFESSFLVHSDWPTYNPFGRKNIKDPLPTDYYVDLLNNLPVYGKWYNTGLSQQVQTFSKLFAKIMNISLEFIVNKRVLLHQEKYLLLIKILGH